MSACRYVDVLVFDAQMSDLSLTCAVVNEYGCSQQTPPATIRSTESKDSGVDFGQEALPRSPTTKANDETVLPLLVTPYVEVGDAMSCTTTSTQLTPVVSWTGNDDQSVSSSLDAHLPQDADDDAESVSQQDADHLASHADRRDADVPARDYVTTAEMRSMLSGQSRSTTATCPLDTVQPHHADPHASAPDDACLAYITLDRVTMSPSNGVIDDRLHSNDSPT